MNARGVKRTSSGIIGLDDLIGGGFPRGSLIILAGNPGAGKTIFSACFLYNGIINYGEKGVYASFSEDEDEFFDNMWDLGLDSLLLRKLKAF
ncbi:MAG: ATPase domain-containing protein [Candidatus Bathyarchaeia archaeon]